MGEDFDVVLLDSVVYLARVLPVVLHGYVLYDQVRAHDLIVLSVNEKYEELDKSLIF